MWTLPLIGCIGCFSYDDDDDGKFKNLEVNSNFPKKEVMRL